MGMMQFSTLGFCRQAFQKKTAAYKQDIRGIEDRFLGYLMTVSEVWVQLRVRMDGNRECEQ